MTRLAHSFPLSLSRSRVSWLALVAFHLLTIASLVSPYVDGFGARGG
jgi:hypothetical protein